MKSNSLVNVTTYHSGHCHVVYRCNGHHQFHRLQLTSPGPEPSFSSAPNSQCVHKRRSMDMILTCSGLLADCRRSYQLGKLKTIAIRIDLQDVLLFLCCVLLFLVLHLLYIPVFCCKKLLITSCM